MFAQKKTSPDIPYIDGFFPRSLITSGRDVFGAETTVEGLSEGHHLHPIQETFTECGGSQCGFCTPGFLVVISALLEENPEPTDDEIKSAIEGNLCRCTGYQQIVDSVKEASGILCRGDMVENSTDPKSDPHPGFAG